MTAWLDAPTTVLCPAVHPISNAPCARLAGHRGVHVPGDGDDWVLAKAMADAYHHHRTGLRGFSAFTSPRIAAAIWIVLARGILPVLDGLIDAAIERRNKRVDNGIDPERTTR